MDTQQSIQIILDDLYKIDPSLKVHQPELIKLIEELIKAKPDVLINEQFRQELKQKILKMAQQIKEGTLANEHQFPWAMSIKQLFAPVGYAIAGAALVLLLGLPFIINQPTVLDLEQPFAFEVDKKGESAFGLLAMTDDNSVQTEEALGMGGGGGVFYAPTSEQAAAKSTDSAIAMPAPDIEITNYRFVYQGEDLPVIEQKMNVYKRINDESTAKSLASYLSQVNFDGFNVSKLQNAKVQNISFAEDEAKGYQVSIDFNEGYVSFNQNWTDRGVSYIEERQTAVPTVDSQKLIKAADNFVKKYDIDLTGYGPAESIQRQGSYYSEVVYPLIINDKPVYEQYGQKSGISLSVDLSNMKVSGLWGLRTQKYQSSLYQTETDTAKLLFRTQQSNYYYKYDNPSKTIEISLNTPAIAYVRFLNYRDGKSEELLAPALIFPVEKSQDVEYFYQENIIVPLIKELFDSQLGGGPVYGGAMIEPPAIEPAPAPMIDE